MQPCKIYCMIVLYFMEFDSVAEFEPWRAKEEKQTMKIFRNIAVVKLRSTFNY
jgi:hypothetical protein